MPDLKNQPTWRPTRKVAAGALGGIPIAMLVALALNAVGVPVSPEIVSGLGAVLASGVAYIVRERAGG